LQSPAIQYHEVYWRWQARLVQFQSADSSI
jgi:hypothetical protein